MERADWEEHWAVVEECRQPVAASHRGAGWINHLSSPLSCRNQRPREPAVIIPCGPREIEVLEVFAMFRFIVQRTTTSSFSKRAFFRLSSAFFRLSMKEVSCGPSQRKVRCCDSPIAHINPVLQSLSFILWPLSIFCWVVPESVK